MPDAELLPEVGDRRVSHNMPVGEGESLRGAFHLLYPDTLVVIAGSRTYMPVRQIAVPKPLVIAAHARRPCGVVVPGPVGREIRILSIPRIGRTGQNAFTLPEIAYLGVEGDLSLRVGLPSPFVADVLCRKRPVPFVGISHEGDCALPKVR